MGSVTVSIVSHALGALLPGLLEDLARCPDVDRVILTRNIPEPELEFDGRGWLEIVDNESSKGFGANHNAAFRLARTPYFAVLNPDIRLQGDPFPELLACGRERDAALCGPAVVKTDGTLEDSAREFPTVAGLIARVRGWNDGRVRFALGDPPLSVPWVAGMFMLVRSADYMAVGGFDEGFFLYYEDVDICARLWRSGRKVVICPEAIVVHDARRASRYNLRHKMWYAASVARYFRKYLFEKPKTFS